MVDFIGLIVLVLVLLYLALLGVVWGIDYILPSSVAKRKARPKLLRHSLVISGIRRGMSPADAEARALSLCPDVQQKPSKSWFCTF